jgi:acyl-CoA synthetase (AMP-forming)/AMP-acid ligase II
VAFLELLPISLHRPTVIAVPLFHGHGLSSLAMALACAAPIQLGRRYEIAPLLSRLPAGAQPIVVSVPTLLERWQATGPGAAPVGAIVTGSAPLDPRLCQQILETRGPVLYNLYGSSEAGVVSMASPAMLQAAPGTVGRPLPGNEVRIVGPGGRQAPPGQVGGIQVRGPLVAPVDTGDWFDTGDLGRLDEEQRLHVCGRADQMFVSGGENVYPQRVRECLQDHPAVHEAVIAVVQDPEFGHRMRAFVVARPGMPLEHDELREWIRERVERFEVPRSIEILPDLPRNALGKVDRPALLELPETRSHSA